MAFINKIENERLDLDGLSVPKGPQARSGKEPADTVNAHNSIPEG